MPIASRTASGQGVDRPLVLSLFPGIGLLDRAFEEEGFCVVRGPDVLWGGDVKRFHPPVGTFQGVIGGPPCQKFSVMRALNQQSGERHGDLIAEFDRCVVEAAPAWFLMENVKDAPVPVAHGYSVEGVLLNNRWFGADQNRVRRFSFGSRDWTRGIRAFIEPAVFVSPHFEPAALAGHGMAASQRDRGIPERSVADLARLQGLPEDFADEMPFTTHGKKRVIGNGVPLPMGRAVARAVRQAMGYQLEATA